VGERLDRENRSFARTCGPRYRESLRDLVLAMNHQGVAPWDIRLSNVVIGRWTDSPYWVDFELSHLSSDPRWSAHLLRQHVRLNQVFGLGLVTSQEVDKFARVAGDYSPVDFGELGQVGNVSDVEVGEGRWRWLLRDLTCWEGKRILDLGSNNCLYALRALQSGAAQVHCIERCPERIEDARFIKKAFGQFRPASGAIHLHNTDILNFLKTNNFKNDHFDITMALCSLYYLRRDEVAEAMRIIARISRECWLQANVETPRESAERREMAGVDFLAQQLHDAGFTEIRLIAPRGYHRPLLLGRKGGDRS
jgi:hypothetical protein